jgi:hypothetical protein
VPPALPFTKTFICRYIAVLFEGVTPRWEEGGHRTGITIQSSGIRVYPQGY